MSGNVVGQSTSLPDEKVRAMFGNGHPPAAWSNSAAQYAVARQIQTMQPPVSVSPEARARIHRFKLGRNRLLGIERNINYQMSEELKQAGGNETLEKSVETVATLRQPMHIYNLWTEDYVGYTNQIHFTLEPWRPSLFALTPGKLPAGKLMPALEAGLSD